MKYALWLLLLAFGLCSAGAWGGNRYQDRRLDIRLYADDKALIVRHAQNLIADDCTITLNERYRLLNARIAGGYNTYPFDQFTAMDGAKFDAGTESIDTVFVQCLRPSLRVRSFHKG